MKLTYIYHACFMLEHNGKTIVFDPLLGEEEKTLKAFPNIKNPDYILTSHGHDDHIGGVKSIVGDNTTIIGMVELCSYFNAIGVKKTIGMNFGGTIYLDGGISVTLVKADHSSSIGGIYTGEPAGFIVGVGNEVIYYSGDTSVFGDMQLIEDFYHPTIGLICAGGRFTADKYAVCYACNHYFHFSTVIPMHYNTFSPIRCDLSDMQDLIAGKTKILLLKPSESVEF